MRISSLISYILSGLLIYASLYIAEGSHLNFLEFWDLSAFVVILAGFMITLVNFRFSEIFNAIADGLSQKVREGFSERYNLNKIIIKSIGNYTFFAALLIFVLAMIIILANADSVAKLGVSFAVSLIVILYALIVRFLFVIPLDTALDKKQAQIKG